MSERTRDPRTRRRIVWTALVMGAVALAFYVGFILVMASHG